jgi:hypothetical protein
MTSALRTFEDFQASLRCYDWLPGTGVTGASDIDLMLERRGKLLFLEAKDREGPRIFLPYGQFLALRTLASLPDVTVLLVSEDEQAKEDSSLPRYSVMQIRSDTKPHDEGLGPQSGRKVAVWYTDDTFTHLNLAGLQQLIRDWWDTA